MGFGDVSTLVQILAEATNNGALIGDITYLHQYESARQWHNIPTMLTIDALHRLYKGTAPPIVLARSLGLQLTNAIKPLKVSYGLSRFSFYCSFFFSSNFIETQSRARVVLLVIFIVI